MIMPLVILGLMVSPAVIILLITQIVDLAGESVPNDVSQGILLWGIMIFAPHGALFTALLDISTDLGQYIDKYPELWSTILFMIVETIGYLGICYYFDIQTIAELKNELDPTFDESCLERLHPDVLEERARAKDSNLSEPLRVLRLRKVVAQNTKILVFHTRQR